MRRGLRSGALLAVAMIFFLTVPPLSATSGSPSPSSDHSARSLDWLLLIYMAADNTLGENGEWGNAALMDIDELEANFPQQGTRALVLADLKGDHNTALYDIGRFPSKGIGSPIIPLSNVNSTWTDEIRSSDWQALRDFLVYAYGTTEAARSMLVIWDHGSGWQGMKASGSAPPGRSVAQDVTDGGIMDLREMRWAFEAADKALGPLSMDIISFDACYMGTLEVFHQVSPWADMVITSEDEQPFYGFNYSFVWRMGSQDPTTPQDLALSIIADFAAEYWNASDYPYSSMTAADLTVLRSSLEVSLDKLASELYGWMYELQVRSEVRFYIIANGAEQVGSYQSDLGDMLRILGSRQLPGNLSSLAKAAKADYDDMIIGEHHVGDGRNPGATGATIYFPLDNLTYYNSIYDGSSGYLSLTSRTHWDEMLREMCDPSERMRVSLNISSKDDDDVVNDLTITILDPTTDPDLPMEDATVEVKGIGTFQTGPLGTVEIRDVPPGRYPIFASKGLLRARSEVKVLNVDPVIRYTLDEERGQEGTPFVIDASSSYDPDGDTLVFGWDLNVADGRTYTDSTESYIEITPVSPGDVTVALMVSDTMADLMVEISFPVDNLRPVAWLEVPSIVLEDEVFTADATESSDTAPDIEKLEFRFLLDGSIVADWSRSQKVNISIGEMGDHQVKVIVRDDQNVTSETYSGITVYNNPPTVNIEGPDSANEDEEFVLLVNGTDTPSDMADLVFEWRMMGGEEVLRTGSQYNGSFPESGLYRFRVKVLDDDGFSAESFKEVRILNKDPIASFHLPIEAYEDNAFDLDASSSSDTPGDRADLKFEWDIDADGSIDLIGESAEAILSGTGNRTIRLIVTDDDGASAFLDKVVLVVNEPPSPTLIGPYEADEDEPITVSVQPGADTPNDVPKLSFIWMVDGSEVQNNRSSVNLSFATVGMHTISVMAVDDQGARGTDTWVVTIRNLAPVAKMKVLSDRIRTGDWLSVSAEGSYDTPTDNGSLKYVWSIDGEIALETNYRTSRISVPDPGEHTILLKVVDDDGSEAQAGPVEFVVEEKVDASPIALVVVLAVLASAIVAALVIGRKVKGLPSAVEAEEMTRTDQGTPAEGKEEAPVIPVPDGLEPFTGTSIPDPPEMPAPHIEEYPKSEPPRPEPVDADIFK